jgi:uncharacterized protein (TIGR00303 family)
VTPLPRQLSGSAEAAERWCRPWREQLESTDLLLLLAATETAAVAGISAAGATPESRRGTAAADAELLLLGPEVPLPHPLPPLPAGVSPALISRVVCEGLGLEPLVVDLGCAIAPGVPHLRPPPPAGDGPARCLSGGAAMPLERVRALLALGQRWGDRGRRGAPTPLVLAECVPGGTTTAQALLIGLGIEAGGIVSGSLPRPAHGLKADLVARGLAAAPAAALGRLGQLGAADPLAVVAAFGDPMQPLAAGLLLAGAARGRPLLLAGGSQMAAVLALALALAPPSLRPRLIGQVAIGTTAWVASEQHSDLALLLRRIGERWGHDPLAFAASLRFHGPIHPALADYERGYVKEGVGAGGLALLWELTGRSPAALAQACDRACLSLLGASGAPAACGLAAAPHPPDSVGGLDPGGLRSGHG